MRKRLIGTCMIVILLCGVYEYAQVVKRTIDVELNTEEEMDIEPAAEEFTEEENVNVTENVNTTDDFDKGETQETSESIKDIPDNGILTVKIHTQAEYQRFISHLQEKTGYRQLWLNLSDASITVYLDEVLAYQNFERLRIKNGGTISFKNTQILTYPIRSIELDHVLGIEEGLFKHIISGDSYVQTDITIELDNRYSGALPIEELLNYGECRDVMMVWDDDAEGEGLLDVQENMENLKEWDYLQSVWETTDGCLKGIYSLNDEEYSYTSYEFYNHYEESWPEICALFICVKDRKSNGKEYFDIIDVPTDKFMDNDLLRRGTSVNRLTRWRDLNFDGYMDLEFHSRNNDSFDPRGYITFLWDEKEQRFILNESAPNHYAWNDTEQQRLIYSTALSAFDEDYYIYQYEGDLFTEKHLKIRTERISETRTGQYFEDGELIARLELVIDEDGSRHFFYEEIGSTREEIQVESGLLFDEVSEIYFPEFDFWRYG